MYSASSVIGFPFEDLLHVEDLYSLAQENWLHVVKGSLSYMNESSASSIPALKRQIDMYVQFLDSVIGLARSKWTEFNLKLMMVGLSIIFLSFIVQVVAIKRMDKFYASPHSARFPQASVALFFSILAVIVRACSFLSNSYICKLQYLLISLVRLRRYPAILTRYFHSAIQWKKEKWQYFSWAHLPSSVCAIHL